MTSTCRLAAPLTALALVIAPAASLAAGRGEQSGHPSSPAQPPAALPQTPAPEATSPGNQGSTHEGAAPSATLPAAARAYGRNCRGESKKHVAGTSGTPFSKCVHDMRALASSEATSSPARACANESKHRLAGSHGTPYSQCVAAAAELHEDATDEQTSTGGSGQSAPSDAEGGPAVAGGGSPATE